MQARLDAGFTLGVDVSRWQGEWDADRAFQAGVRFAFIRATASLARKGEIYIDERLQSNAQSAMDAGLLISYYHHFRPNFSAQAQAAAFWRAIERLPRHFPPVLDLETDAGMKRAAHCASTQAFLENLEAASGQKAIIYTRAYFWNKQLGNPGWAADHLLWIARYHPTLRAPWSENGSRLRPLPWRDWTFWQYTSSGDGPTFGASSKAIDLNRFNGSLEDLHTLARRFAAPSPTPPWGEASLEQALERLWHAALAHGWEL